MKFLLVFYTFFFLAVLSIPSVLAQTPSLTATLFLTWHANTYVPNEYAGKALATPGSSISFAVEALSGGQLVPLKTMMIRWYVDGKFAQAAVGLQTFETQANVLPGNDVRVRVEVPDFPGGSISKTAVLRIIQPKAVIEAPFPNLQTEIKDFSVRVVPYFFSVFTQNSLAYHWLVNDQPLVGGDDPQVVSVKSSDLSQSGVHTLAFRATAENSSRYTDKGESSKTITIQNTGQ